MASRQPPSGSGSTPWRPIAGNATGRVAVGRYTLDVGGAGGTIANQAPPAEERDATELREALAVEDTEPSVADQVEEAVDTAADVTGRVERAAQLVTDVAEGRILNVKALTGEVDALVRLLTKLDQEGKYTDVLRLARSLSVLLALLMRWMALVHSLRVALRAARTLGDLHAQGWILHELGTLALGADDAQAATRDLNQARDIRKQVGDQEGLAATNHNLGLLRPWYARPLVRALAIAAAVLAVAGAIVAVAAGGGSKEEPKPTTVVTPPTSTQTTSPSQTTSSTTTSSSSSTTVKTPTVTLAIQDVTDQGHGRTGLTFVGSAGGGSPYGDVTVEITPRGGGTPQTLSATVSEAGRWSVPTILKLGGYTAVARQDYGADQPAKSAPLDFSVRSGTLVLSTSTSSTTTTQTTSTTTVSTTTSTSNDVIP
jgi:hypothetical protein